MNNQPKLGENETSRNGADNTIPALTTRAAKDSEYMADSDSIPGKSPAFQFYPGDFVGGTVTLSTEEVGAYILLMCHAWDNGEVPHDLTLLARIARLPVHRMRRVWSALERKFRRTDTGYFQPRIEKEREKQVEFRRRQSDKGKASAANRKATRGQPESNHGSIPVGVGLQPEGNSSSSVFSLQSSDSSQRAPSGALAPVVRADARSNRPIYVGQRLKVFEWMLDDLCKLLGRSVTDALDLHEWFYALDARMAASNQVVPLRDGGKWLQEQTLAEAERRGLIEKPEHKSKLTIALEKASSGW